MVKDNQPYQSKYVEATEKINNALEEINQDLKRPNMDKHWSSISLKGHQETIIKLQQELMEQKMKLDAYYENFLERSNERRKQITGRIKTGKLIKDIATKPIKGPKALSLFFNVHKEHIKNFKQYNKDFSAVLEKLDKAINDYQKTFAPLHRP